MIQDERNNVSDLILKPGTFVMLKNEGLINKLAPKFNGPFRIVKSTSNYNYVIVDTTNTEFKRTVPRHKLKVIDFSDEHFQDSSEVKEILQHRKINNQTEYQVRWADDSIEWVNESDFNSKEIINEYKNKKIKRRGRPPKNAEQPNSRVATPRRSKRNEITVNNISLNKIKTFSSFNLFSFLLIFIYVALFGFKLVNCHKVNHKLKFCDITSSMPVWDERDECHLPKIDEAKVDHSPFIILSKMHDLVNGDGWQCYKTVHSYEYTEIAWARSKSSEVTNVHLKRRECKQMVDSKMCGDNKMTCENSNCWYTPTVTPDYKWWDTVTVKVESCKFHPKTIVAKDH